MKKFLLILISLLFLNVQAITLRGSVNEEYIPNGFYGSWAVISKLDGSNNPMLFNKESRDIWTLSGRGNILTLQNLQSGASSEIEIKEKSKDGKSLQFKREKTVEKNNQKTKYTEIVSFKLYGNNFSGTDKFSVEEYGENNALIKKSEATYIVEGVKISGSSWSD